MLIFDVINPNVHCYPGGHLSETRPSVQVELVHHKIWEYDDNTSTLQMAQEVAGCVPRIRTVRCFNSASLRL